MTKCSTCGGTYTSLQPDNTRYHHVCPPLSDAEVCVTLGVATDPATWSAKNKSDVAAAPRVRPNTRNENVPDFATLKPAIDAVPKTADATYWKSVNAIMATSMVAAGAGTTIV